MIYSSWQITLSRWCQFGVMVLVLYAASGDADTQCTCLHLLGMGRGEAGLSTDNISGHTSYLRYWVQDRAFLANQYFSINELLSSHTRGIVRFQQMFDYLNPKISLAMEPLTT